MSTMRLAPTPRAVRAVAAAPVPEPAPLRLTRRGRVVLALLAALLLGGGGLLFANGATADVPEGTRAVTVRTVGAGESLWAIASSVTAPGADVRDALQEIAELNGLTGPTLAAGQQLIVPAVEAD